jgi:iron(III) transport system permease protein
LGVVGFWGVRALWVGNPLGSATRAAVNSFGVASLAALTAILLSLPVAVWAVRYPSRLSRTTERLCHSGYALPGIVIALSLVFLSSRYARPLYQGLAVLILAYVIRFFPQALGATRSSLAALSPRFEEAARSLGLDRLAVTRLLTVPMIRGGLLSGAGLVFLTAMKELPATLILRPIGFETLATRIWSAAAEGIYSQAAIPALGLVIASGLPVYWLLIRPVLSERA